ncbi:Ni/Fe hydrogenase subunit alpha [Methanocella sp. CWC-04]|uniref:Ni/Fe hydrogenase subunit alpha n=1 Tax=Methanooceanicella nereidis TaxID=2052831 RepID=A0AAP2RE43_9EURY|nr:Ni/Fe hydrogenase subunit alpha [Methanocella sp. CWC-04]MCD1294497.1 Ni/Fe hydrogenase subunit alpha [Methanocella sp. CWC-04]
MVKQIKIAPVSRIEGHAQVTIDVDDSGKVSDARLNIMEVRGFEKFLVGRPVEEAPRTVTQICGICPVSHHLAGAKAVDACFGVETAPTAKLLRELMQYGQFIHSHSLHFYFLAAPDFVFGPDASPEQRNVFGIIAANPELAVQAVKFRKVGQQIVEATAGRSISPVTSVPGGITKGLTQADVDRLLPMAKEAVEFSKATLALAKPIFNQYIDAIKILGEADSMHLGLVKNGNLELYDGQLRLIGKDGATIKEFDPKDYLNYIAEYVYPHSYLKAPYWKEMGWENGMYRVSPLSRINACDQISTPLANAELQEFRKAFGRPAQLTLLYHYARLIELLYSSERAVEMLSDPAITGKELRVPVKARAGTGVGVIEAPRGTLMHDYDTDENGIITKANIIVATAHNNKAMNVGLKNTAQKIIDTPTPAEGILNRMEMVIRAYDPCFSCATHTVAGKMPLEVVLNTPSGKQVLRR